MPNANFYEFMSDLERRVYNWLTKHKIPFNTQETMFGYSGELGSATVDFVLPERNIVLRVMGGYYHSTLESQARDDFGKEQLINKGYQVVDLWEDDLATPEKLEATMRLALQGQETIK